MEPLAFLLLAFTPGIFWLWLFIRRAVYRPGPRRLLAHTFLLGMVSTIPAGIINAISLKDSAFNDTANLASVASGMLFVVGPAEETCKYLAVRLLAYRSPYFDEPGDGLVYSTAASLGFASLENLLYIIRFGPAVMIGRAPLSTVAHVVFGSFWGYALGEQVRTGQSHTWQTIVGLAAGAVAHGFFNIALFVFWPADVVLVALGIAWTLGRFAWARRVFAVPLPPELPHHPVRGLPPEHQHHQPLLPLLRRRRTRPPDPRRKLDLQLLRTAQSQ